MALTAGESAKAEPTRYEDWWESSEGHLFVKNVKMPERDRTVCLRCWKPFEDTWEDNPCESQKNGRWTNLGIESILITLREGDDKEAIHVINDAAEIIEQLRASPPAAERTALKELRKKVEADLFDLRTSLKEYSTPEREMRLGAQIKHDIWFIAEIDAQERAGEP